MKRETGLGSVARDAAFEVRIGNGPRSVSLSRGRLMDGMHRVRKAMRLGESHIRAVRFAEDPEPDFVGLNPSELPYDD